MDECYLLAAVLMVIGLQLGNGDIQITTNCRTGAKNSYDQLQGINVTNGVHLTTHPPEATFGGNAIRCLTICDQETDCSVAVMDGNSKECLTYSYNLALGAPVKVVAPTFTSYIKALSGYFVPKQTGPYTYSKAQAACKKAEMKLPKIESEAERQELELVLKMFSMTDGNNDHLVWLQAHTLNGGKVNWDDGTEAISALQPTQCQFVTTLLKTGCTALVASFAEEFALMIESQSFDIYYGLLKEVELSPGNIAPVELTKYVICK